MLSQEVSEEAFIIKPNGLAGMWRGGNEIS